MGGLDPIKNVGVENNRVSYSIPHIIKVIHCPSRHTRTFEPNFHYDCSASLVSSETAISDNGGRSCNRYVPVSLFGLRINVIGARHSTPSPLMVREQIIR